MAMEDYFADMSLIKLEEEIWRAEEALRMDMLKFGDYSESNPDTKEKATNETIEKKMEEQLGDVFEKGQPAVNISEQSESNKRISMNLPQHTSLSHHDKKDLTNVASQNIDTFTNSDDDCTVEFTQQQAHDSNMYLGVDNRYLNNPTEQQKVIRDHLIRMQNLDNENNTGMFAVQSKIGQDDDDDEIERLENELNLSGHTHKTMLSPNDLNSLPVDESIDDSVNIDFNDNVARGGHRDDSDELFFASDLNMKHQPPSSLQSMLGNGQTEAVLSGGSRGGGGDKENFFKEDDQEHLPITSPIQASSADFSIPGTLQRNRLKEATSKVLHLSSSITDSHNIHKPKATSLINSDALSTPLASHQGTVVNDSRYEQMVRLSTRASNSSSHVHHSPSTSTHYNTSIKNNRLNTTSSRDSHQHLSDKLLKHHSARHGITASGEVDDVHPIPTPYPLSAPHTEQQVYNDSLPATTSNSIESNNRLNISSLNSSSSIIQSRKPQRVTAINQPELHEPTSKKGINSRSTNQRGHTGGPPPPFVVRSSGKQNFPPKPPPVEKLKSNESKTVHHRSANLPRPSVTERMHEAAKHRAERLLALERQKQEEEMETERRECTFKPCITKSHSRNTSTPRTARDNTDNAKPVVVTQHSSMVSSPLKTNTSSPQDMPSFGVGSPSGSLAGSSPSSSSSSLAGMRRKLEERKEKKEASERLYQDAVEREALKCAIAGAVQQRALESCTFAPEINKKTDSILSETGYVPLPDRLGTVQRNASQTIQHLRETKDMDPDLTFHPRLNERSRDLAYSKMDKDQSMDLEVGERLQLAAANIAEKKLQQVEAHARAQAEQHTFQPTVSEGSKKIAEKHPKLQTEFLERQKRWAEEEKQVEEAKKKAQEAKQRTMFKPDIRNSQSSVRARTSDINEEGRVERMSVYDRQRIELAKKRIQEQFYSQFNFKPTINEVSRLIGHDSSVEELVANPRGIATKMKLTLDAERRQKQECPFKPDLSRTKDKREALKKKGSTMSPVMSPSSVTQDDKNELNSTFSQNDFHSISSTSNTGVSLEDVNSRSPHEASLCNEQGGKRFGTREDRSEERSSFKSSDRFTSRGTTVRKDTRSMGYSLQRPSFKDDLEERFEMEERRKQEIEEWRATQRSAKQLKELEECTFKPQLATRKKTSGKRRNSENEHQHTSSNIHNAERTHSSDGDNKSKQQQTKIDQNKSKPVVVRGLGRYLEVRAAAEQQKREKQEADALIARGGVKRPVGFGPHRGTTQVLPFQLSESNPQLKQKLHQEHENVLREQCTFQPRTNETIGAEALRHLLDDDDDKEDDDDDDDIEDDGVFDFERYGDEE